MDTKNKTQKKARILKGEVVSDKMNKTVVVKVSRMKKDPKYKKYYSVTQRFKAHDEEGVYKTGDEVFIKETRPTSKEKRWTVVSKID
ncbi:MAG: 30S ribosomal protein S17 [Candidatus Yanofskybacteria bacterium RIFCSPHIGHO2_01_FULL_43_42]|uniref:Small ribosomal subunit protein uS17 n=1 Tax=Candidatus Yanofskybacteria bacterium RIFCSPLOWO2_01_FULL_43_22 TaxID=1802695 RepID=A0A1F8GG81_9BACT|nr:MAG: 30S ribosomal protein S17 [Candidatus Yanofskybacteria bacterium RIFCSPHIGHO2_01_FULL_43_42]OGN12579.1 MAG: 30S ribosomal protein S17 [Candidatus Yanofskybacteria bacterium RIFCSPHIGHO2_02_FULL_43_17]OGN23726.1 MAG: 30S ribosomal protein S17 [Candidatus Yanofskybacteria bacterium RIFCSPLOWO2_01_FULL_43_22]